jgi:hypothetical protein
MIAGPQALRGLPGVMACAAHHTGQLRAVTAQGGHVGGARAASAEGEGSCCPFKRQAAYTRQPSRRSFSRYQPVTSGMNQGEPV